MIDQAVLDQLFDLIAERLGLAPQNLRREKLEEAIGTLAVFADGADAVARLRELDFRAGAWQSVIAGATILETRFLRQPGWFHQIEILALAPLIRQRRRQGERRLRIWSAACATGEEAYTLAMLVNDLLPDRQDWQIEILATDINAEALQVADSGIYAARQIRELDPSQVARHFERVGAKQQRVLPSLRGMVRFGLANLAEDSLHLATAGRFDLIVCRNVLIYLTPEIQRRVAAHLCASLTEGGWLAVAPAEAMVDWFRPLTPVNAPEAILFCRQARPPREAVPMRLETARETRPTPSQKRPDPASDGANLARALPRTPATLEAAKRLADRGALIEACALCNDLLATDELNGEACLLLSAISNELGDFPAAYQAARRAIYLLPASAQAHFQFAGALRNLGRGAQAKRTMAIATRLAVAEKAAWSASENRAGDGDGQ